LRAQQGLVSRVLHLRIKDKHANKLIELAREVNMVWNYVNDLSIRIFERERRFTQRSDLHAYTAGASKEGLRLHSQTIQAINEEYLTRRRQFKKIKLNWRTSNPKSARRSLGWIPFKSSALSYKGGQVRFCGEIISSWDSYGLANYVVDGELGPGNFSQDAKGRWYLNVTVQVKKKPKTTTPHDICESAIGIDLGLKEFLSCSDGQQVEAQQFYRNMEAKLATAQRAKKDKRVKAIHSKIANRRKDFLHKESTKLARNYQAIIVGDVNASGLAQTTMAKSVLDAGWSAFRTMLKYKCDDAGVWFREVNESYTTQECSHCGGRHGPKGRDELHVRAWTCCACGAHHDRDINAAKNIMVRGLGILQREFDEALEKMEQSAAADGNTSEPAVNKDSGTAHKCNAMAGVGHGPLAEGIPVL